MTTIFDFGEMARSTKRKHSYTIFALFIGLFIVNFLYLNVWQSAWKSKKGQEVNMYPDIPDGAVIMHNEKVVDMFIQGNQDEPLETQPLKQPDDGVAQKQERKAEVDNNSHNNDVELDNKGPDKNVVISKQSEDGRSDKNNEKFDTNDSNANDVDPMLKLPVKVNEEFQGLRNSNQNVLPDEGDTDKSDIDIDNKVIIEKTAPLHSNKSNNDIYKHKLDSNVKSVDKLIDLNENIRKQNEKIQENFAEINKINKKIDTQNKSINLQDMIKQRDGIINKEDILNVKSGDKYNGDNGPNQKEIINVRDTNNSKIEAAQPKHIADNAQNAGRPPAAPFERVQTPDVWPPGLEMDIVHRDPEHGPGEHGKAIVINETLLSPVDQARYKVGWTNNQYNEYASNMTSVHRSLNVFPDMALCKAVPPPTGLPQTSVIIIFHNEGWSALLRTVHSVLDRSPRALLREVILVDDASNMAHLGAPLDNYISKLQIVRLLRTGTREGLIRARLVGFWNSTAPTVTFLDSHCECNEGWLEPLLARVAVDDRIVTCPVIDRIAEDTLELQSGPLFVGGFSWNLVFTWHATPEKELKRRQSAIDPIRSPTMAGGLFTISRRWFIEIGTYDEGMDIWGAENLEISFRIWMCGGQLEIIPCSRVGHIFRKKSPYKWPASKHGMNVVVRNNIRMAEVWMDGYKHIFYGRIGLKKDKLGNYGDVTSRREIRQRLQCKNFQWYLDNIYPELYKPGDALWGGPIQNQQYNTSCLDAKADNFENEVIKIYKCGDKNPKQFWMMSKTSQIRRDDGCFDYNPAVKEHPVEALMYVCTDNRNQYWEYTKNLTLFHPTTNKCLDLSADGALSMHGCHGGLNQKWTWQNTLPDMLKELAENMRG